MIKHRKNFCMVTVLLLVLLGGLSFVGWLLLPEYSVFEETISTRLTDRHGQSILWDAWWKLESLWEVDTSFIDLIVQIEDQRFYRHPGVDGIALMRSLWYNTTTVWHTQWGSTIEQQYLKLLQDNYPRTWQVKLLEIFQAMGLQWMFSKQDILTKYLNQIPFPYWRTWLVAWCQLLYGKECRNLFLSEQLFIIAVWQLWSNPFNQEQFEETKERSMLLCRTRFDHETCDWVAHSSPRRSADLAWRVVSDVSPVLLQYLLSTSEDGHLPARDSSLHTRISRILEATQIHREQYQANDCCVIVLDKAGNLVSMNVCAQWSDEESGRLNMCLQPRQTGSSIKPFVYLYAFDALHKPRESTVIDEEETYILEWNRTYTPKNFDFVSHGELWADEALASSLNVPSVKLIAQAGVDWFVSFLSTIRLFLWDLPHLVQEDERTYSADRLGLSIALWTYEMSPLLFTKLWWLFVREWDAVPWNQSLAKRITEALAEPYLKTRWFGLEHPFHIEHRAIKTWTSRHFVDGWTCGVRTNTTYQVQPHVICVRMGNANSSPMEWSGAETAGYIWRLVAEGIH